MSKDTSKNKQNKGVNTPETRKTPGKEHPEFEASKWAPGQSGNPKGRPVGAKTGLRARLGQMLDKMAEPDILKVLEAKGINLASNDNAAVIAHVVGREAIKGNMQAVKIIADQTEQPHPRDLNLSGDVTIVMDDLDQGTL